MESSNTSEIRLKIQLDEDKLPQRITWEASETGEGEKECKAFNLSIWDAADRSTLRIDLWTKEMPVNEMTTHFFQTLVSLGETYERATGAKDVVSEMKSLSERLAGKVSEQLKAKNMQ